MSWTPVEFTLAVCAVFLAWVKVSLDLALIRALGDEVLSPQSSGEGDTVSAPVGPLAKAGYAWRRLLHRQFLGGNSSATTASSGINPDALTGGEVVRHARHSIARHSGVLEEKFAYLLGQQFRPKSPFVRIAPVCTRNPLPLWKRALDLAICVLASPVLLCATLCVAAVMLVSSRGSIFFRQERTGYMGRPFRLYKFRTMTLDAAISSHQFHFCALVGSTEPMVKLDAKGDKRLIPGGWFLRASGLDELPQIVNVLRGEMTIVGPRPCLPFEYEHYSALQRKRLDSVPGITGLWQVCGKNRTTFDRMVELDIAYAERKSLALDLLIILRTPAALLTQISDVRRVRSPLPQKDATQSKATTTLGTTDNINRSASEIL